MSNLLVIISLFIYIINGDVYMQCNRGSNNRLDEANRDRDNGNRCFDSQNNNRGGYNVGKLAYYVGEHVPICWTNQHSSGKYQLKGTELVLQYMCDVYSRDGTSRTTPRDNPTQCRNYDCDRDVEYCRHESFEYYQYCKATSRNKGLFTANQNLAGNRRSRRHTRQNPQGTRRGYECPEERDYYPWWGSSPWKDIAIFTNDLNRCGAYERESQNVKDRQECIFTDKYWKEVLKGYYRGTPGILPITESECLKTKNYTNAKTNETFPMWKWVTKAKHNIPKPECLPTAYTRTNHHGIIGRKYWTYDWKVPNDVNAASSTCCVIRLRYNITTDDYPAWKDDKSIEPGVDYRNNTNKTNPNPDRDPALIDVWTKFGLTYKDIENSFKFANNVNGEEQGLSRGYVFRNNPRVDPHGDNLNLEYDTNKKRRLQLQLAINTNQFGRTFQDRTHCFQIKPRPTHIPNDAVIQQVTVQGKRGNIVQVYPATEYFFVPEPVQLTRNTYVHFCWTGSNTNPNNNDGQGKRGTDRSNICPLTQPQWSKKDYGEVDKNTANRDAGYVGDLGNNYPDYVDTPNMGFPMYYNYANKRDRPRKSRTGQKRTPGLFDDKYDCTRKQGENCIEWNSDFKHMGEDLSNAKPWNIDYNKYYFSEKGSYSNMAGLSQAVLNAICTQRRVDEALWENIRGNSNQPNPFGMMDYGNMEELDDAGTTFCVEPLKVSVSGCWNFLSTRNNNFSNRSQKGTLCVGDVSSKEYTVTDKGYQTNAGDITMSGETLLFLPEGGVKDGFTFEMEIFTWYTDGESNIAEIRGKDGGILNSGALKDGVSMEVHVSYTPKSLSRPVAYYRKTNTDSWSKHADSTINEVGDTTYGVIQVRNEGYYQLKNEPNIPAYIAFIIAIILMVVLLVFIVMKKCKPSEK